MLAWTTLLLGCRGDPEVEGIGAGDDDSGDSADLP
jgi:hypothetical protein